MCTMKIELDKDKIAADSFATYEEMMEDIDQICADTYFHKTGHGEYELNEGADLVGAIFVLVSRFRQQIWLIPVIKLWNVVEGDGYVEDALAVYKRTHAHDFV